MTREHDVESIPLRCRRAHALLACVGALIPLARPAGAQAFDWTATFGAPGAHGLSGNESVNAIAVSDDPSGAGQVVFVGGSFGSIGGCPANHVARWDGTAFSALGAGVAGGGVSALAQFQGELYVGGNIVQAGGQSVRSIARWDGASWSPLAGSFGEGLRLGGSQGFALGLVEFDDGSGPALVVVGWFDQAGGLPMSNVAKWTGSEWAPLGAGLDQIVEDVVVWDDGSGPALYVCGFFDTSAGQPVNGVARWNGSTWQQVGSGGPPNAYDIGAFASASTGGLFVNTGALTWRWDGASWSATNAGGTHGFATFDDGSGARFFAGAHTSLLEWNGSSWSSAGTIVPGPSNWGCRALAAADFGAHGGRVLIAAGDMRSVDAVTVDGLAVWDGAVWSASGATSRGLNDDANALALFDDGRGEALYAAGAFTQAGEVAASHVARWDGVAWEALGSGVGANAGALATFDDGAGEALFVGGAFQMAGGAPASRIARWDGTQWTPLGAGLDWTVLALAAFDDGGGPALYAGGIFTQAGGVPANRVARWDGAAWSAVGAGFNSSVNALAVHDVGAGPELYAAGAFVNSGGQLVRRLARWSGSAWVEVGGGLDDVAWTLLSFGNGLIVGGEFLSAGGASLDHLVRWDGTGFGQVTTPSPDRRVKALAAFDDGQGPRLYVGGWFDLPVANIGRVEGTQLVALGLGTNQHVEALAVFDDGRASGASLYAGGPFDRAGLFSAQHVARWANGSVAPAASYCTAGTTANGCQASISASGEARRCAASGFDLTVGGVEGQKLGILFFGSAATSTHWGAGTSYVCVTPPTTRAATQSSGGTAGACDGAFALDFNAWMYANPYKAPAPGNEVFLQAWFRDPPSSKGTSLSDALRFEVAP